MIKTSAFDYIKSKLRTEYGKTVYISDKPLSGEVPMFPCVSIVQLENSINRKYSTLDSVEQGVAVEFEVNVYSNDIQKKEEQTSEIMEFICDLFTELRFYRTFEGQINNLLDDSICRRNAKFSNRNITR